MTNRFLFIKSLAAVLESSVCFALIVNLIWCVSLPVCIIFVKLQQKRVRLLGFLCKKPSPFATNDGRIFGVLLQFPLDPLLLLSSLLDLFWEHQVKS